MEVLLSVLALLLLFMKVISCTKMLNLPSDIIIITFNPCPLAGLGCGVAVLGVLQHVAMGHMAGAIVPQHVALGRRAAAAPDVLQLTVLQLAVLIAL